MRAAFVLVAAHRAGQEPGGPIAVSAGAIRASESFTITGISRVRVATSRPPSQP